MFKKNNNLGPTSVDPGISALVNLYIMAGTCIIILTYVILSN